MFEYHLLRDNFIIILKMGLDEDMDRILNNIGYYAAIGWSRAIPYVERTYKFIDTLKNVFKTDLYLFFSGQDVPFNIKTVKYFKDISGAVFYNVNERRFYENPDKKCKNLPYLSAVVKLNDVTVCDLTDWISKVKYSTDAAPNIRMLVMAWTLESGTLLNISKKYYMEIIDDSGDNVRVEFNT